MTFFQLVKMFLVNATPLRPEKLGLVRLEAPIFEFNRGSARVLEKNGFEFEGLRKKDYRKKGVFYNSLMYAKIAEQDD